MEFHRVEPHHERTRLREFLAGSDPDDYLLEEFDEWVLRDRLWVGEDDGRWVAFGRLHDLGEGEGWVSGVRVVPDRRGHGLGGELVDRILSDARSLRLEAVRAVIENENTASSRLFGRHRFAVATEMTLRCGTPALSGSGALRPARPGEGIPGPIGWLAGSTGRVDVLPGVDGGRFGRWRPELVRRWSEEGKLFLGPGIAVAVQTDWWKAPRTLWANPLVGDVAPLVRALAALTRSLQHEQWQAFLPSGATQRAEYEQLGLRPHPEWGDRVRLFEWLSPPPVGREPQP